GNLEDSVDNFKLSRALFFPLNGTDATNEFLVCKRRMEGDNAVALDGLPGGCGAACEGSFQRGGFLVELSPVRHQRPVARCCLAEDEWRPTLRIRDVLVVW